VPCADAVFAVAETEATGMATVMLARNRNAPSLDQYEVHAYPLNFDDDPPTILIAPCGHRLAVTDAEQVDRFTGVMCMACLLLAFGRADRAADVAQPPPELPDELAAKLRPAADAGRELSVAESAVAYSYGVALRGEHASHLVEPDAIRGELDGRDVVQTLCRHLAWGPMAEPVEGWQLCDECDQIAYGKA
jgi:hypothetical protein